MVFEHTLDRSTGIYWSSEERRAFALPPHGLPDETIVWIASYAGPMLASFYGGRSFVTSIASTLPTADFTRAALVIGKLVLQVEANRHKATTGREALVWPPPHSKKAEWIWPVQHQLVSWPTADAMTEDEVSAFARGAKTPDGFQREG
jgi:hypothetical protein